MNKFMLLIVSCNLPILIKSVMNVMDLRRGELGGELRGLGLARPQEGARLERHDRPRVQPQRPRVRGEVAEEARRVEKAHLQR